jgi:hypothetical protein
MLYKVSPFGYFGRMPKLSRGANFEEYKVEDDGLEWYYVYQIGSQTFYLLSNNIAIKDRDNLSRFYQALQRNNYLALGAGLYLGLETVLRVPYFKTMAVGWRVLSLFGTGVLYKSLIQAHTSQYYGPVVSAFFRKYHSHAKTDLFEITDRKREYFEIDTSQYMNYNFGDLGHDHHAHHGPQPDGEA